jgi:hypothetical protein
LKVYFFAAKIYFEVLKSCTLTVQVLSLKFLWPFWVLILNNTYLDFMQNSSFSQLSSKLHFDSLLIHSTLILSFSLKCWKIQSFFFKKIKVMLNSCIAYQMNWNLIAFDFSHFFFVDGVCTFISRAGVSLMRSHYINSFAVENCCCVRMRINTLLENIKGAHQRVGVRTRQKHVPRAIQMFGACRLRVFQFNGHIKAETSSFFTWALPAQKCYLKLICFLIIHFGTNKFPSTPTTIQSYESALEVILLLFHKPFVRGKSATNNLICSLNRLNYIRVCKFAIVD